MATQQTIETSQQAGEGAPMQAVFETVQGMSVEMTYVFPLFRFQGVTSIGLEVRLPRNALVGRYDVTIQAQRVDETLLQQVAQLRTYSNAIGNEMVVDFGTPRTVSGLSVPAGTEIAVIYPWIGSQFSMQPAYVKPSTGSASDVVFPEVRSERLRVVLSKKLSDADLAENVWVRLPEPPAGLEIRIDGAPPVWTHPEAVQPNQSLAAPNDSAWSKDSKRIVHLGPALAALTGDPLAGDDPVSFQVLLTTQIPCLLDLKADPAPEVRCIRRVRFGTETAQTLDFETEGALDVPLALPPVPSGKTRAIEEVRWTAAATLAPERTLPPLGPDPAPATGLPVLAELLLDADRAACVRLSGASGLAELVGLRLPLAAPGDGAEARVVLWSNKPGGAEPLAPLPGGTSDPVTFEAGAGERWVSFAFPKPVAIDPGEPPWAAVLVARGELAWSLAGRGASADPLLDPCVIRRGSPNGPWRSLPAPLQSAAGLIDARGRLRLTGHGPKEAPLAPLLVSAAGTAGPLREVTPTPKGVPASLAFAPGLAQAQPTLRVVSRVAGSVTLRDIDVISTA